MQAIKLDCVSSMGQEKGVRHGKETNHWHWQRMRYLPL
jgi:hypothetical protein